MKRISLVTSFKWNEFHFKRVSIVMMKPFSFETSFNCIDFQMKRILYGTSFIFDDFRLKRVSIVSIFKWNEFYLERVSTETNFTRNEFQINEFQMKRIWLETSFNSNDFQMERISYGTSFNLNWFHMKRVSDERVQMNEFRWRSETRHLNEFQIFIWTRFIWRRSWLSDERVHLKLVSCENCCVCFEHKWVKTFICSFKMSL